MVVFFNPLILLVAVALILLGLGAWLLENIFLILGMIAFAIALCFMCFKLYDKVGIWGPLYGLCLVMYMMYVSMCIYNYCDVTYTVVYESCTDEYRVFSKDALIRVTDNHADEYYYLTILDGRKKTVEKIYRSNDWKINNWKNNGYIKMVDHYSGVSSKWDKVFGTMIFHLYGAAVFWGIVFVVWFIVLWIYQKKRIEKASYDPYGKSIQQKKVDKKKWKEAHDIYFNGRSTKDEKNQALQVIRDLAADGTAEAWKDLDVIKEERKKAAALDAKREVAKRKKVLKELTEYNEDMIIDGDPNEQYKEGRRLWYITNDKVAKAEGIKFLQSAAAQGQIDAIKLLEAISKNGLI